MNKQKYFSAIVLVLVAGLIVAYATGAINFQNPKSVLEKMIEKSESVKTEHFVGTMGFEFKTDEKSTNMLMSFFGDMDQTDKENPRLSLSFDMNLGGTLPGIESINADLMTVGYTSYLKIGNIDNPEFKQFIPTDTWIRSDLEEISKLSGQKMDLEALKKSGEEYRLKAMEIFKKANIVENATFLKGEKIGGENTYHIQISLNKANLVNALFEVINLQVEHIDSDTTLPKETIEKLFEHISFDDIEIWVARSDYTLRKISFVNTIANDDPTVSELKVNITAEMSDINKPVNIIEPKDSKSIFEVFPMLDTAMNSSFIGM